MSSRVWRGQVLTPWRHRLIKAYRKRRTLYNHTFQKWMVNGEWGKHWTVAERAAFSTWRQDFMRPSLAQKNPPGGRRGKGGARGNVAARV